MKKYEAILLSYGDNDKFSDPSKKGFNSEEDAWDYVIKHLCELCRKSKDPIGSSCAAEWTVDEYELDNKRVEHIENE